ncbi:MAG: N-acetylmuramic acid 6-phosphate phosphatase [Planctomycetes bacterium]|nr:N-acetylmuramic acid 6-phosphate phosphatase [Planctomycetota bacterium]
MSGRIAVPKAVLFDLDGTLVDSLPDIAHAINKTRREHGLPEAATDTVRSWIGGGAARLVARSLGTEDEDDPAVAAHLRRFLDIYSTESGPLSPMIPGARALLDALAARGVRLACTTNKPGAATDLVLSSLGIRPLFGAVVTPDSMRGARKPDPRFFAEAMAALCVDPPDALVVGDGVPDVAGARSAGLPSVAVLGGYGDRDALAAAGSTWTVETVADLLTRFAW